MAPNTPARTTGNTVRTNTPDINAALAAERGRMVAIINSPEGLASPKAAMHLATKSNMAAPDVISLLREMKPVGGDNPYVAALERESVNLGGINVGSAAAPGSREARLEEINGAMVHHNAVKHGRKAKSKD